MTAIVPAARSLLADGRVVGIRPLRPDDAPNVQRLYAGLSERDRYLRFFSAYLPPRLDELVAGMTASGDARRAGLGAYLGDVLVGAAHFEVLTDPAQAEVALVVDHAQQTHGVGTLLLEHLASVARGRGVRRFVAEVLTENAAMLGVFRDAGLPVTIRPEGSTCSVTLRLDGEYPAAVQERERQADVASLRAVLRPASIAVIGASRRGGSIGNAVLRKILDGGYAGSVRVVNPHAAVVQGVPAVPAVHDLPRDLDLAVLCVPAAAVPAVAQECGAHGVRALLVISSGLTGSPELSDGLLAAVRRYGMRLVGPNCLGLVNTDPAVRLDATFARDAVPAGHVGVVTQSGGIGIALLEQFRAVGLGVSTMVSTGDKYDVSGNDLLLWWQRDEATDVAVLYLESFGNPRKFARLARDLADRKPVLTVRSGSSEAGVRAAASHTAAAATPVVTRDALFEQAGVIAVDTMTELVAATCALSWLPLPAGDRVAIVSNAGGIGVLAADACTARGLPLPEFAEQTVRALGELMPEHGSLHNPVDTTAGIADDAFAECVRVVLADPGVDAVLVITAPTAITSPADAIGAALAEATKPVVAVRVGSPTVVQATYPAGSSTPVPVFGDPATAAGALAAVARYARWRRRPTGTVPHLPDLDIAAARAVADDYLAGHPDGGWLAPTEVNALLGHFGLPVLPAEIAPDGPAAVALARRLGLPVALKAVVPGVLHKSRAGGLALGLRTASEVAAAYDTLRERFGADLTGVLVQPMAQAGRELLVGVVSDEVFGALVVLGIGGVDAELVADRSCRLLPLTEVDAADMVSGLRASPMLFDADPVDTHAASAAAVADVLLRVARLAELLPEIAEADLNPVIVRAGGCRVPDARIRLAPREPTDPYLRRLRG